MSDDQFTNRHGHTISGLQVAVDNLPEPDYKTAERPEVRRRKRRVFRLTRLQLRILLIVIAVVLLAPVVVGEYVRATYTKNIGDAKSGVSRVFATTLNQQKSATTSKSLADIGSQLSTIRDGLCPGGFLDNLAELYPRAQAAYADCALYRSSVTVLVDQVNQASSQMAYLESLQPLLEGVLKPLEDQFAVLSAQQENWQTFVDGMNRLSVPLSLSSAHASFLKEAMNVRDQWIALVQATNTQNSAEFSAARTKLTESFTAFRAQTTTFSNVISTSQTNLSKAVAALQ